jgi:hypothetical protein
VLPTPLKESDFLKAFIVLAIASVIAGAVSGAIVGGIAGFIMGAIGVALPTIKLICGVLGAASGLVFGYFIFRATVLHFIVKRLPIGQAV